MSISRKSVYFSSCLAFAILVAPLMLCGQNDIFVIHELGAAQNLSDERYNYYIHLDSKGLVWISSIAGLNRFDGREIKTYRPDRNNTKALRSVYVSTGDLYDTDDQNLWFSENKAVIKYHRRDDFFEHFQAKDSIGESIECSYDWSYFDPETDLFWFYNHEIKGGLYTCDTRSTKPVLNLVTHCDLSIKARMYRSSERELQLFSHSSDTVTVRTFIDNKDVDSLMFFAPPTRDSAQLYDILPIDKNLAWVASSRGLYQLNLQTKHWTPHFGSYQNQPVVDIRELVSRANGDLLLGTHNGGIFFYQPATQGYTGKIRRYKDGSIQAFEPSIDRLYLDKSNNLWVSTQKEGIYYTSLSKPKFNLELFEDAAVSVASGPGNGATILGFTEVYQWQPNGQIDTLPLPLDSKNAQVRVKCLFRDSRHRLWLCAQKGLYYQDPGSKEFEFFQPLNQLAGVPRRFTSMTELTDGSLLVANIEAPVLQISPDRKKVSYLSGTEKGTAFIAAIKDVSFIYYEDNRFLVETSRGSQSSKASVFNDLSIVNQVAYDEQRSCYWVATDNGLFKLWQNHASQWQLIIQSQLQESTISSLLCDEQGSLWMGTPHGILKYQPDDKQQHLYALTDLLQGYHFNRSSAVRLADGRFLFGGTNGINYFDPATIQSKISPAQPQIIDILINQKPDLAAKRTIRGEGSNPLFIESLDLSFQENNLTIFLSAGEYSDPERCRFVYQLIGSNDKGMNTVNSHILSFNSLAYGKYQLNIWAVNADGLQHEIPRTLEWVIRPPFYLRGWFLLLALGIILGICRKLFVDYRERQRLEWHATESELALLRLQMTPHFISNSLSAIGTLVGKGNPDQAHNFLGRFADLMRKILINSEEQTNTLQEEITMLGHYLSLEQLRFQGKMTFAFHSDNRINLDEAVIPTMILQPFVENAILHGIKPKTTAGHVQINFLLPTPDQLLCEVRDNGVGHSQIFKEKEEQEHVSMSTEITRRRLKAIAKSLKLPTEPYFEIEYETDAEGMPAGTTVRVFFPLID